MSIDPSQSPSELIEAYLDDQLSAEAKVTFEQAMLRQPKLREQLERYRAQQGEIDASLRRMFAAPDASEALIERLRSVRPSGSGNGRADSYKLPASRSRPPVRRSLLIAASIAFLVCGPVALYFAWQTYNEPKAMVYAPKPVQPLDVAYREEVKAGFKCDWECKTESEFAMTFTARLGQPLLMKALPAQVSSLGLSYVGGISPLSIGYLARVEGNPVMVFVDQAHADRGQSLSNPQGLKLFKRDVGSLVLYEVTPLDKPHLLDLFYVPEAASKGPPIVTRRGAGTRPTTQRQ